MIHSTLIRRKHQEYITVLSVLLYRSLSIIILLLSIQNFYNKVVVVVTQHSNNNNSKYTEPNNERQQQQNTNNNKNNNETKNEDGNKKQLQRILYCITSMNEYDNGRRETIEGYDRYTNLIVPVIQETVTSILQSQLYTIDVYLITHYHINSTRYNQLRMVLPTTVQLFVWDNATPLGYLTEETNPIRIQYVTRALARQHRYVIKDKITEYDIFLNFEDDMIIHAEHVQNYVQLSHHIQQLQKHTPNNIVSNNITKAYNQYYGTMTQQALQRIIPGFIRVEVIQSPNFKPRLQERTTNGFPNYIIPIDYERNYNTTSGIQHSSIDLSICCHIKSSAMIQPSDQFQLPTNVTIDKVYFWETSIEALGVRKMPQLLLATNTSPTELDWVVLQGGSNEEAYEKIPNSVQYIIGDYWSYDPRQVPGSDNRYVGTTAITERRPPHSAAKYCNNQGGWIGTQLQIMEWNNRLCRGGYLPPFNRIDHKNDGLDYRTVEYWSGGIQLFGPNGCNIQRIIPLQPSQFGNNLLYHVSNNKQRVRTTKRKFQSIQQFWGQLNTIKKNAENYMNYELSLQRNKTT